MSTPWIILATIAFYFLLLFVISWITGRKADNAGFFTGNRKSPWYLVAIAMIGAPISGVTFISVPGAVAANGYSYMQMVLGFFVGALLVSLVLIPMFYRMNLVSIYGYLEDRFGKSTYHTGAWFFFVSKMLGAAVRFYVVCVVLQSMVFGPLGIPFAITVVVSILLIWIYTVQGGVKTLIWTDTLKSFCLVASVGLCIYFIAGNLGLNFGEAFSAVTSHSSFKMFYFDDPLAGTYFWKQFLAGIFMAIALNGLDQDMMQRNLACRDSRQSQKNMIVSGITQFFVIALFLILGTMLLIYMDSKGMAHPAKPDDTFAAVVDSPGMPIIVGILFIVGLVSAAYSAAGSALTSLTTSFTVDIMGANRRMDDRRLAITRRLVHLGMSVAMGLVIIAFYYLSNQDAISAVYTLASYTYGPILGLFVFGLACKRPVRDCLVPAVCILAPVLSWVTQWALKEYCNYTTSFELLLMNAAFTILGLLMLLKPRKQV